MMLIMRFSAFCAQVNLVNHIMLISLNIKTALQMSRHCENSRWASFAWDHIVNLTVVVCEGFLWYGLWRLNARFVIADPYVGGWVNHIIGTVLLIPLQLFSYAGSCGCSVDPLIDGNASSATSPSSSSGPLFLYIHLR